MKRISITFSLIFIVFVSVSAHESRPVFVQIKQENAFITINYSVPSTVDYRNLPHLQIPNAAQITKTIFKTDNEGFLYEAKIKGNIQDLKGKTLAWKFPYYNPTLSAVVQIYFENTPETHVLSPQNEVLDLTEKTKNSLKANAFLGLGIEHIFKGIDHLLFVLCLLIITGISRKLFWTITGFTIAHSISLFLSVMGFVHIPVPFVEVCIALSIIVLCVEIVRQIENREGTNSSFIIYNSSLTYQYPFLISSIFGLLHGLGFAAVLTEIGLPEDNLVSALLFFNVGVEIGQVLFIAVILTLIWVLNKIFKQHFENQSYRYIRVLTYTMGIVASFWFFERINAWY